MLSSEEISSIINNCEFTRNTLNQLSTSLSQLLLERHQLPIATQLVNHNEMLRYAGLMQHLISSLNQCIDRIHTQSLSIQQAR